MKRTFLTSESVTEGHPDKIADRISDSVLDSILANDPQAHVACETFLTTGLVLVGGEITTTTYVDVPTIVREVLRSIGYDKTGLGFHYQDCSVLSAIKEQSTDIASAVDRASEVRIAHSTDPYDVIGAGDQGVMFGYARSDTDVLMPLPIQLAHRLTQRLTEVRKNGTIPFLRPDGKSQVTIEYEGDCPVRATTVLIAAQHDDDVDNERIRSEILKHVIHPVLGDWLDEETTLLVNSSGRFVIGGPASDAGLTGRKIIVDTYGGFGSHGGGAFSGKDPTKVDRSGPLAVNIDSQCTGSLPDDQLRAAVLKIFDFRPGAIIDRFEMRRPIYAQLSAYGHFGRTDIDLPWERLDQVEALKRAAA